MNRFALALALSLTGCGAAPARILMTATVAAPYVHEARKGRNQREAEARAADVKAWQPRHVAGYPNP